MKSKLKVLGGMALAMSSWAAFASTVTVEATYPVSGANWMDYIYNHTDTACLGSEEQTADCTHAGELRKVVVADQTLCAGLTAQDSLNAFDWSCDDSSGSVIFYSQGLKAGKGLKDLITASDFRLNSMNVTDASNTVVAQSDPARWWNNPVVPLTDNSTGAVLNLDVAGTIYTLDTSRTSAGYRIAADKVAVVVFDGQTLSYNNSSSFNCNYRDGSATGANRRCLLSAGAQKYFWIEGSFDGFTSPLHYDRLQMKSADFVIGLFGSRFSRLQALKAARGQVAGLFFKGAVSNTLNTVQATGSGVGLKLVASLRNQVTNFNADRNWDQGLLLQDHSDTNVLTSLSASAVSTALDIQNSAGNSVTDLVALMNINGVKLTGTTGTVFKGALILAASYKEPCLVNAASEDLVNTTCTVSGTDGSSTYNSPSSDAVYLINAPAEPSSELLAAGGLIVGKYKMISTYPNQTNLTDGGLTFGGSIAGTATFHLVRGETRDGQDQQLTPRYVLTSTSAPVSGSPYTVEARADQIAVYEPGAYMKNGILNFTQSAITTFNGDVFSQVPKYINSGAILGDLSLTTGTYTANAGSSLWGSIFNNASFGAVPQTSSVNWLPVYYYQGRKYTSQTITTLADIPAQPNVTINPAGIYVATGSLDFTGNQTVHGTLSLPYTGSLRIAGSNNVITPVVPGYPAALAAGDVAYRGNGANLTVNGLLYVGGSVKRALNVTGCAITVNGMLLQPQSSSTIDATISTTVNYNEDTANMPVLVNGGAPLREKLAVFTQL